MVWRGHPKAFGVRPPRVRGREGVGPRLHSRRVRGYRRRWLLAAARRARGREQAGGRGDRLPQVADGAYVRKSERATNGKPKKYTAPGSRSGSDESGADSQDDDDEDYEDEEDEDDGDVEADDDDDDEDEEDDSPAAKRRKQEVVSTISH